MALDIHKIENGRAGEFLFSIDDLSFSLLKKAFELYENKTGLCIDPYSNRKLSSGFGPLIASLNETTTNENKEIVEKIIQLLKKAESDNYGVIFVGD